MKEDKTIKINVKIDDIGKRLDILLSEKVNFLSRSKIKNLINSKKAKINKVTIITPSRKLKANDIIELDYEENNQILIKPKKIKLDKIYEDKDILIVNKPNGMVVHPGSGNYEDTLVNALVYNYKKELSNLNGTIRPGIVHRLDKDTSGLLVIAKNNFSHSELGKQFSNHTINRKYIALIWDVIRPMNGKINTLISRDKRNRQLMTVSELQGKKAVTNYKTLKVFSKKDIPKISLVEFNLETGRTHQIRVHLKYKNTSLLGDKKYKKRKNLKFKKIDKNFEKNLENLNGQALHAESLGFTHPASGEKLKFKVGLPSSFKKLLHFLEKVSD
tara:strand:+ start:441 stop:1430 length:990 start_codon:yes stop_codon:yes gene_type:complete